MRSMTGFASKTASITAHETKVDVTIHIKSVNARFFESNFRMPSALFQFETSIIKLLKKALHRGNIFFSANVNDQSVFKGGVSASTAAIPLRAPTVSSRGRPCSRETTRTKLRNSPVPPRWSRGLPKTATVSATAASAT